MAEYEVAYSQGTHKVRVGDTVTFYGGDSWRIGEPVGRSYSPSGIGGCLDFKCYPLGEVPRQYEQYVEDDGAVVFCGDSIAASLACFSRAVPREGERQ